MELTLNINDRLLEAGGFSEKDIKMILGVALYNNKVTSTGYVSKILDIDRRSFIEEMGKYGGVLVDMTFDELIKENENAEQFTK